MDHEARKEIKHYGLCFVFKISHETRFVQRKLLKVTPNKAINVFECMNSNFWLMKNSYLICPWQSLQ